MKKRYIVIPAAMYLLVGVCIYGSSLPEGFDRPGIYRKARQFVTLLNQRRYDECYHAFNASMQTAMSPDKLYTTLDAVLSSLGAFVRFKGISASPKRISGEDYAFCTVKCVYEEGTTTFTISLDKELRIGGLYIK